MTEEAERLRREAEEETARKRREVEEAERKRKKTEEAERKRREAEGADHERNRKDAAPHAHEPSSETMRGLKCLSVAITRSPWSKPRRATSGLTPPQTKTCRTYMIYKVIVFVISSDYRQTFLQYTLDINV